MNQMQKLPDPLTYILHVPLSNKERDLKNAREAVDSIVQSVASMNYDAYIDTPDRLLVEEKDLSKAEILLREEHVQMIEGSLFETVHISGSGISAYVRDIVRRIIESNVDLFCVIEENSILDRYVTMLRSKM